MFRLIQLAFKATASFTTGLNADISKIMLMSCDIGPFPCFQPTNFHRLLFMEMKCSKDRNLQARVVHSAQATCRETDFSNSLRFVLCTAVFDRRTIEEGLLDKSYTGFVGIGFCPIYLIPIQLEILNSPIPHP